MTERITAGQVLRVLAVTNSDDGAWLNEVIREARPRGIVAKVRFCADVDAVERAGSHDLYLLDESAVKSLTEATRSIRQANPEATILIVSPSPHWKRAREAILAGANDYVHKSASVEAVLKALDDIRSLAAWRRQHNESRGEGEENNAG